MKYKQALKDRATQYVEDELRRNRHAPEWEIRLEERFEQGMPQRLVDLPPAGIVVVVPPTRSYESIVKHWLTHFKQTDKANLHNFYFTYDKTSRILRIMNALAVKGHDYVVDDT